MSDKTGCSPIEARSMILGEVYYHLLLALLKALQATAPCSRVMRDSIPPGAYCQRHLGSVIAVGICVEPILGSGTVAVGICVEAQLVARSKFRN